jgi:hypothetical protein
MDLDRALFGSMGRRGTFLVGMLAGIPVGFILLIALIFWTID